jgi:hypothetical protein
MYFFEISFLDRPVERIHRKIGYVCYILWKIQEDVEVSCTEEHINK